MTFHISYQKAYFSRTCFCNIPAHWIAENDDGVRYDGFSMDDVQKTVLRYYPSAKFAN